MRWRLEYYIDELRQRPVEEFIDSLTREQQGKVWQILEQLENHGANLEYPFTSQVAGRLRELRIQAGKAKIRILYYGDANRSFVLLHGVIKKTPKLPDSDRKKGLKRMQREKRMNRSKKQHQAYLQHKSKSLGDSEIKKHFEAGLDRVRLAAGIIARRTALNLSQTELAARIRSSPSIVSKLERGGNVELNTIEKVAKALEAQIVIDLVTR